MVEPNQHQQFFLTHAFENAQEAIESAKQAQQAVLEAQHNADPNEMRVARDQLEFALHRVEEAQNQLLAQDPVHDQQSAPLRNELVQALQEIQGLETATRQPKQVR